MCGYNECNFMKLITLEKIYKSLKFEEPEVTVDASIIEWAAVPIKRMLEISAKLGL
jgi:quinolinate synthase